MRPEELRPRRTAAHLTIAQLSDLADVSEDTISKIENGHRTGSPLTLTKLEAALVHPCQELLEASKRVVSRWVFQPSEAPEWTLEAAMESLREVVQSYEGRG